MPRKKDPTSVRQRALKLLNSMTDKPRTEMMDALRSNFPTATERYCETLWGTWRRDCKANGSLIEVFSIRDMKDGKPVKPYLKSEYVFTPVDDDVCDNPAQAVIKYEYALISKIAHAKMVVNYV